MGTQAVVGLYEKGKLHTVLVNYDGYVSHTGKVLLEHYKTSDDVRKIIDEGEIRNFEEDGSFSSYEDSVDEITYSPGSWDACCSNISEYKSSSDYIYIFNTDDEKWYVAKGISPVLQELTLGLIDKDY